MDAFPGDLIYITVFCTLGSPVSGPEQVVSALLESKYLALDWVPP